MSMQESTNHTRVSEILEGCREDAAEQLRVVREMIIKANPDDIKELATIVMASENATLKVKRLHELSIVGGGHELVIPTR